MKKRIILAAVAVVATAATVALGLQVFARLGGDHTADDRLRYAQSSQYDADQDRFVNHNQQTIDGMKDTIFDLRTIVRQLRINEDRVPEEQLPEVLVDMAAFLDDTSSPNIIWLGHSSFMVRIAGKTLLIDPVFENAGPVSFIGRRFQKSVLAREDLPAIDHVLISHDHYDHLEASTVRYLANRETDFIVPIGVGTHLRQWGVSDSRITEKDWWQEMRIDDLLIATVPAQHYSGRGGFLANDTLWVSFVIASDEATIYFSGDSGYGPHFEEVGRRYGPFELAFLENGQYSWISREVHMHPEDTIAAFNELSAKVLVPIHWAMFTLSRHPWYEPAERVSALASRNDITLYVPQIGEMMSAETRYQLDDWWIPMMQRQQYQE